MRVIKKDSKWERINKSEWLNGNRVNKRIKKIEWVGMIVYERDYKTVSESISQ